MNYSENHQSTTNIWFILNDVRRAIHDSLFDIYELKKNLDLDRDDIAVRFLDNLHIIFKHKAFWIYAFDRNLKSYADTKGDQLPVFMGKKLAELFLETVIAVEESIPNFFYRTPQLKELYVENQFNKLFQIDKQQNPEELKKKITNEMEDEAPALRIMIQLLREIHTIDQNENTILEFALDVKEAMENHFLAVKDMHFVHPTKSINVLSFQKDELVIFNDKTWHSFVVLGWDLIEIQLKIINAHN